MKARQTQSLRMKLRAQWGRKVSKCNCIVKTMLWKRWTTIRWPSERKGEEGG